LETIAFCGIKQIMQHVLKCGIKFPCCLSIKN